MSPAIDSLLASKQAIPVLFERRIQFREAVRPDAKMNELRRKYLPINASAQTKHATAAHRHADSPMKLSAVDGPKQPRKRSLFDGSVLSSEWRDIRPIGPGLVNFGNTCFMNATLQCIAYTPPLANLLLKQGHSSQCQVSSAACMLCELEKHIKRAFASGGNGHAIEPKGFVHRLKAVAKHFRLGRQEDAHEYCRYLVDAFQKSCLYGTNKDMDAELKRTTLVHTVFGGRLRSRVHCSKCQHNSDTFDPCLDLSLDLYDCDTIEKALRKFALPDSLRGANKYKCEKCNAKVDAEKRMTMHDAPRVLTIQLKRFNPMGGKLSKPIAFKDTLDLRPVMSDKGAPLVYSLYGVLVHSGGSCNSGHYYSYVKAPNCAWYCMNDESVQQVSLQSVMRAQAYILFYTADDRAFARAPANAAVRATDVKPVKSITAVVSLKHAIERDPMAQKHRSAYPSPPSTDSSADDQGEIMDKITAANIMAMKAVLPSTPPPEPADLATPSQRKRRKKKRARSEGPGGDALLPWEEAKPASAIVSIVPVAPFIAPTQAPVAALGRILLAAENAKSELVAESVATQRQVTDARVAPEAPIVSWNEPAQKKRAKLEQVISREAVLQGQPGRASVASSVSVKSIVFNAEVPAWDDVDRVLTEARRQADAEQAQLQKRARNASRLDMHDREYDRGRVKKLKKNNTAMRPSGKWTVVDANVFQREQDKRNSITVK